MSYILGALLLVAMHIIWTQYQKNLQFEQIINEDQQLLADVEVRVVNFMENLLITYTKVLAKLVRIDRNGGFESDDEVGFVFKTLKNTIEELKVELENLTAILKGENGDEDDTNKESDKGGNAKEKEKA